MRKPLLKFLIILSIIFLGRREALADCFAGAGNLGEEACCISTEDYCYPGDAVCGGCTCATSDLVVVTGADRPVGYTLPSVCCYPPPAGSTEYICTGAVPCKVENEQCSLDSECCADSPLCGPKTGYGYWICQAVAEPPETLCLQGDYWNTYPETCCGESMGEQGEPCCVRNKYRTVCDDDTGNNGDCFCYSGACQKIGDEPWPWVCPGGCGDGFIGGGEQCGEGDDSLCDSICAGPNWECTDCQCECGDNPFPRPRSQVYTGPVIKSLEELLAPVSKMLYFGGLAIGVFFIILAGYKLMTSEGDPQRTKAAQEQLTSAIIGIIFILLSVTILRIIIQEIIKM